MAAWFRTLLRTTLMVMHMAWRAISTVKLQGHTGWQKPSGCGFASIASLRGENACVISPRYSPPFPIMRCSKAASRLYRCFAK